MDDLYDENTFATEIAFESYTTEFVKDLAERKSMTTTSEIAAIPRYFLLEDKHPIGPTLVSAPPEDGWSVVYGFSNKPAYDRFLVNSERELRPYPLTSGYLKNRSGDDHERHLVVLDAHHPSQQTIAAVTANTALTAQSASAAHVDSEYQLKFDSVENAYRITEFST